MADGIALDLETLRYGKRTEVAAPQGHIIADPHFKFEAGKYIDNNGNGHVCVSFTDPKIEDGTRRVYLIPRAGALRVAEMLRKVAGEVTF